MADDLSEEEDQMQMGRGGGADDEDDDMEMDLDPRQGGGDARQRGNMLARPSAVDKQRQKRQPAPYNDGDDF
jgi:hypothetical protein